MHLFKEERTIKTNLPPTLDLRNHCTIKVKLIENNYKKFIVNGYDDFSTEDLNHLNQNGYCILKNCLDTKLIESIKNKFQKYLKNIFTILKHT